MGPGKRGGHIPGPLCSRQGASDRPEQSGAPLYSRPFAVRQDLCAIDGEKGISRQLSLVALLAAELPEVRTARPRFGGGGTHVPAYNLCPSGVDYP